ncbi:hypothetical protein [Desulfohalobium retbaense]|uniref:Uncharacterized protein n=1 Tax=Desulfohalobium retbaense (strain ATCC 49708 / DSM 5692 / JCM 16813 / HR100) TaxID=485915 RepID=C8X3H9_DESRD|nr:hypothetical protein [Desulfohalobium retbaense]ACV68976.1 conserved hypothetical protein [Desulfohalobium retbaense DSM 5692]
MARFAPYFDGLALEEQIKTLGNDELLDFWEEAHVIDSAVQEQEPASIPPSMQYERAILQELQLRSCQGSLSKQAPAAN